jgi:hypothetical protein
LPASRRESLAALAACTLVAVLANWRLLKPEFVSADALVHQYWMWQFRDPGLFNDPLTAELRRSARYPEGYEALFRLASQVADPIVVGELAGVALMAVSAWLIFLIVREQTAWRPAAWLGAALFLAMMEIHRFYGGFPRAFVHPVVLLTVLLALRDRQLAAALVAAAGALLYPPAAVLAVGVLCVSALGWPRPDMRRARFAALAVGLAALAVLVPRLVSDGAPRVMSASEARAFPEFGADGPLHFFVPSVVEYLSQNRSGFDLRTSGSILAVAALALLLARPANLRLLRREVLALPVVALCAWGLSQAVLFKLYLPHRYTYPLIAFFAIAVAVSLEPTWSEVAARRRLRAFGLVASPLAVCLFAVYVFPLAPAEPARQFTATALLALVAGGLALAAVLAAPLARASPAIGAALIGLALAGAALVLPDRLPRGNPCPDRPVNAYLRSLPKDAVIAGDPGDLMCVPATARRPVVISTQLAPAYEADYFRTGRTRMFATLRAYYGHSSRAIADLLTRYGATHLWVRRRAVRRELADGGVRWRGGELPYGRYVRQLLRGGEPAVLHLPLACRRWRRGDAEVYDIRCIASGSAGEAVAESGETREVAVERDDVGAVLDR